MNLRDPLRLWLLISEYGPMQELYGLTPQSRGQRLNGLIADLLECWGISAESDIRSHGEIDVGFEIESRHFVVEAKWEATKTDLGPLAKLQKRLRQRLQGTVGVFLSMAGFTADAIKDLKDGDPLSVICLTQEHFEAMLSGFVPPAELLLQCLKNASRRGVAHTPLIDLFGPPTRKIPDLVFAPPLWSEPLVVEAVMGFEVRVAMSGLPHGLQGAVELAPRRLLLTLPEGIALANLETPSVTQWLNFPNCSNNPVVTRDGWVYFARHAGIARVRDRVVQCVAGGFIGNVRVIAGAGGGVWVFSNGCPWGVHEIITPCAVLTPDRLGKQELLFLNYPPAAAHSALHLAGATFLIGSQGLALVNTEQFDGIVSSPEYNLINAGGLIRLKADQFLIACTGNELWELRLPSRAYRRIAKFSIGNSCNYLLSKTGGGGYLTGLLNSPDGTCSNYLLQWNYPLNNS